MIGTGLPLLDRELAGLIEVLNVEVELGVRKFFELFYQFELQRRLYKFQSNIPVTEAILESGARTHVTLKVYVADLRMD